MPAAYSNDLREKAMAAITRGERPGQVARLFGISRNTLNLWRQRHAQMGSWAAKTGYQHGHSAKSVDWEEFRRFADTQGGQTLEAMARVRGVGRMTISRGLKKIGFTRKKRPTAIRSGTKPDGSASSATSAHVPRRV